MSRREWIALHLRNCHLRQHGINVTDAPPWRALQDSERTRWLELADAAMVASR